MNKVFKWLVLKVLILNFNKIICRYQSFIAFILPQHLQRDACDAVRFHWDVILHSYIRRQEVLVHHWNMTTNKYNDPSGSFSCKSLEVHNMEVIVEERHQPQNKQTLAVDVCMSRLPQVLEQELLADQKKLKYFSSTKKHCRCVSL